MYPGSKPGSRCEAQEEYDEENATVFFKIVINASEDFFHLNQLARLRLTGLLFKILSKR